MKLGLGLYRDSLTDDNFQFARQAGVTHLVIHLVDYFAGANPTLTSGNGSGWGSTTNNGHIWTVDELVAIRRRVESHGLVWEAIENFDPGQWHDVLLDGPRRDEQMEGLKQLVRNVGEAGIPVLGYNFSIAGVWGWTRGPFGRGGAVSVKYDEALIDKHQPMPKGMVWNMVYDPDAPEGEVEPPVSSEQIWSRLQGFLEELVPVAEEAGVRLALHPDDPPVDQLRGGARLVNQPDKYQRVLDMVPSDANALEFCLGSLQEMTDGDLYDAIEHYGRQGKIAYIHFRNVRGKVPAYQEVFVDEGDIDMLRVMRVLKEIEYDGVVIPDHTPEMTCAAPWHAGMAYALGYIRAAMQAA